MKSAAVVVSAGLAMVMSLGSPPAAVGQSAPAIAVVDPQFLFMNADAAKIVRAETDKIRAAYQQDVKVKQDEIDALTQAATQQRAASEDAYHQRMREVRQKAATHQSDLLERQTKMDREINGATEKIARAVEQIVDEIVRERKLSVVLTRSTIVGTPTLPDITQDVLRRLNQRIPRMTIEMPK